MRTCLFSNYQKNFVVEVNTDAITNVPNKTTIHDIKVVKGQEFFDGFVASGFGFRVPDVVDANQLKDFADSISINCSIINPDTGVTTVMNEADAYAIVEPDSDVDADADISPYQFTGTVGEDFYEPIGIETENGIGNNSFSVSEGDSLPNGLEITPDGLIYGTPEEDGEFIVSIDVRDATGQLLVTDIELTISAVSDDDDSDVDLDS